MEDTGRRVHRLGHLWGFENGGGGLTGATLALPLGGAALISYEALWRRGREVNMPPDTQCRLRLNYPLTIHLPW